MRARQGTRKLGGGSSTAGTSARSSVQGLPDGAREAPRQLTLQQCLGAGLERGRRRSAGGPA
eukprot:9790554-Alexandrium_andersonii.AAC.1